MDALWVKGLTHSQQRLHLMLLVWLVLCKPKAMTGARGDAPCHIPQGPPKYRPSDKRPEEGEGPAVTEVASHAGCRLRGAQTWVAVVPRHLPPHHHPRPPPPNFRHASSGARSFSKLTAQSICAENSQHRASARRDTRPTGQDPEAVRLAHSFGKALTGNGKTLAANPMKPVRIGLV